MDHKGYRCLDPLSNRVIISRHVTFNETSFPFAQSNTPSINDFDFLSPLENVLVPIGPEHPFFPAGTLLPASTLPLVVGPTATPGPAPPHAGTPASLAYRPIVTSSSVASPAPLATGPVPALGPTPACGTSSAPLAARPDAAPAPPHEASHRYDWPHHPRWPHLLLLPWYTQSRLWVLSLTVRFRSCQ